MIDDDKLNSSETQHAMMLSADILQFFARGGEMINRTIRTINNITPSEWGGKMQYPPSVVFDVDDNLDWVHPFNSTYVNLGTRAYDGTELEKGAQLMTTFPDGTEMVLWSDKLTMHDGMTFDVEMNKARVRGVHETARMADGVTVPSPFLADYYRDVHKCSDVYVFPNTVIPEDYPKARLAPHEGIRILWQGGSSHLVDWFPLRDAVREISLRYPQVKWVIWGLHYPWVHDNIPPAQLELMDWVPYPTYKAHRVLADADINLCPLIDNQFNRSKSCIKFYEGSVLEVPEATLAGNCRPYSEEIVDGENGMLYRDPEEFVTKLSALIENVELRRDLARRAKAWVLANRHYEKTIPGLFEFYQHLRAKKKVLLEV